VVQPEDPAVGERKGHLIVVADGLGGHAAGQVASATAVRALADAYYSASSPSRVEPALHHAVRVANLRVHDASQRNPDYRSMQTTLTCLVLAGSSAYVAHVGDSRAYHWREGTLTQLTEDHSEAAELVRLRLASPASLADHPRRNVLTRTLGHQLLLRPDFRRLALAPGDVFILCTDGLWSEVTDDELAAAAVIEPEQACAQLIELQLGRASLDNATVQVVKVNAVDPVVEESEGWLNAVVGRWVRPRRGRPADEQDRGRR
jgi:serine/threonine protein phosphatase PrpC